MPDGQIFRTITYGSKEGKGLMKGFKVEMDLSDRWAVVAYVRALQYSHLVDKSELSDVYGKTPDSLSDDK
jgi:hypothetical protein